MTATGGGRPVFHPIFRIGPPYEEYFSNGSKMSDISVDYGALPDDVREKLAELELELSEGKDGAVVW